MEEKLDNLISRALFLAKSEASTRENSLVITKLEEALMWYRAHQQSLQELARKAQVGIKNV
jgi:hypothetical protein